MIKKCVGRQNNAVGESSHVVALAHAETPLPRLPTVQRAPHGAAVVTLRCCAVFDRLVRANMSIVAFDMHGHGRSEPTHDKRPHDRALIRCKTHLISDAMLILDTFALPMARNSAADGSRLPLFGVAHSLGSAVLTFVEKKRPGTFAVRALSPHFVRRITPSMCSIGRICIHAPASTMCLRAVL